MIDLNPYIPPDIQKKIGSLMMSDKAADELGLILVIHGHADVASPDKFGPVVAASVSKFLVCGYFAHSAWFRAEPVHRTVTLQIKPIDSAAPMDVPLLHLQKTANGYTVVACKEAPLSANYDELRVIEETKVEWPCNSVT